MRNRVCPQIRSNRRIASKVSETKMGIRSGLRVAGAVWCSWCLVLGMTWPVMVFAAGREQPEQTVKEESITEGVGP